MHLVAQCSRTWHVACAISYAARYFAIDPTEQGVQNGLSLYIYRVGQKNYTPTVSQQIMLVCANKACFVRFECDAFSIAQAHNI